VAGETEVAEAVEAATSALKASSDSLAPETLDAVDGVLSTLTEWVTTKNGLSNTARIRIGRLQEGLQTAMRAERLPPPSSFAENLRPRIPSFLNFDDDNRTLRSDYDLANPAHLQSAALQNLASVADLPLEALRDAITAGDVGAMRSYLESAQTRLAEVLRDAWKQSSLRISFDREGTTLRISVSSHGDDFFYLDNRSDGLRIFIALRAFLAQTAYEVSPILLVDEAERHLHYDAQADLVRVFEEQDAVAQVIYTTHSIGCLPQDLGRGIRVVTPEKNGPHSSVENIWTRSHTGGVSPLMEAMGAATVSLAPSRYVVIGEGPTEAMLLPSMLREATGQEVLDFQVVSGIAESSDAALERLEVEAARVVYIVDGDKDGERHSDRLKNLSIKASRIVKWSGSSVGICLEDLLDPNLYTQAINEYLRSWPPNRDGFPTTALRRARRPQALKEWCATNSIPYPSKVLIAEQVLRILDEPRSSGPHRLTDVKKVPLLIRTHMKLSIALGLLNPDGTPVLSGRGSAKDVLAGPLEQ
jgi:Predicted ATP-dependent endonuclease of the OLD family